MAQGKVDGLGFGVDAEVVSDRFDVGVLDLEVRPDLGHPPATQIVWITRVRRAP
jgi:hypothetical protein